MIFSTTPAPKLPLKLVLSKVFFLETWTYLWVNCWDCFLVESLHEPHCTQEFRKSTLPSKENSVLAAVSFEKMLSIADIFLALVYHIHAVSFHCTSHIFFPQGKSLDNIIIPSNLAVIPDTNKDSISNTSMHQLDIKRLCISKCNSWVCESRQSIICHYCPPHNSVHSSWHNCSVRNRHWWNSGFISKL